MKAIDVKYDSYVEYNEESNERNGTFKIGDHVRIAKYKDILKDILLIGQKKFL